jgi:hypothetical protein
MTTPIIEVVVEGASEIIEVTEIDTPKIIEVIVEGPQGPPGPEGPPGENSISLTAALVIALG